MNEIETAVRIFYEKKYAAYYEPKIQRLINWIIFLCILLVSVICYAESSRRIASNFEKELAANRQELNHIKNVLLYYFDPSEVEALISTVNKE